MLSHESVLHNRTKDKLVSPHQLPRSSGASKLAKSSTESNDSEADISPAPLMLVLTFEAESGCWQVSLGIVSTDTVKS